MIHRLPIDISTQILIQCHPLDLVRWSRVSKSWRNLLTGVNNNQLYYSLIRKNYPSAIPRILSRHHPLTNTSEELLKATGLISIADTGSPNYRYASPYNFDTFLDLVKTRKAALNGELNVETWVELPDDFIQNNDNKASWQYKYYQGFAVIFAPGEKEVLLYDLGYGAKRVNRDAVCYRINTAIISLFGGDEEREVLAAALGGGKLVIATLIKSTASPNPNHSSGREFQWQERRELEIIVLDILELSQLRSTEDWDLKRIQRCQVPVNYLTDGFYTIVSDNEIRRLDLFQEANATKASLVMKLAPVQLVTNGKVVAFSSSFLTQVTTFTFEGLNDPHITATYSPDPSWRGVFLQERCASFVLETYHIHRSSDFRLILLSNGDILTFVTGIAYDPDYGDSDYDTVFFKSASTLEGVHIVDEDDYPVDDLRNPKNNWWLVSENIFVYHPHAGYPPSNMADDDKDDDEKLKEDAVYIRMIPRESEELLGKPVLLRMRLMGGAGTETDSSSYKYFTGFHRVHRDDLPGFVQPLERKRAKTLFSCWDAMVFAPDDRQEYKKRGCGMEIVFQEDAKTLHLQAWYRTLIEEIPTEADTSDNNEIKPVKADESGSNSQGDSKENINKLGQIVKRRVASTDYAVHFDLDISSHLKPHKRDWIQGDSEMIIVGADWVDGKRMLQVVTYGFVEEEVGKANRIEELDDKTGGEEDEYPWQHQEAIEGDQPSTRDVKYLKFSG